MNPPESVAFPLPTLNPEPAVPRSAPARKLPKDQWEVHREIIEEMYPMKGITLKDIIKYLAERGFTVTERQLKRKIQNWKLDKNVKGEEMRMIVRKQQRRKNEEGKSTLFRVRGQPVPQAKIDRYQKRYETINDASNVEMSLEAMNSPAPTTPTLSVISYETASERGQFSPQLQKNALSTLSPMGGVEFSLNEIFQPTQFSGLPTLPGPRSEAEHLGTFQQNHLHHSPWRLQPFHPQYTSLNSPSSGVASSEQVHGFSIPKPVESTFKYMQKEEEISRRKLYSLQTSHGMKSIETLEALLKLANILLEQGNHAAAEDLLTSKFSIRSGLDDSEPITLRLHWLLASSIIAQGKKATAVAMFKPLFEKSLQFPSMSYIRIEVALYYGYCLQACGNLVTSEKLFRECITLGGKFLAPDHDLLLKVFCSLALSLKFQERYNEAESILREVAQSYDAKIGPDASLTLRVLAELGIALGYQNKYQEADELLQSVAARQLHTLGPKHYDTIWSQIELGNMRIKARADDTMLREAYVKAVNVFGKSHSLALMAHELLADFLVTHGRLSEAIIILEQDLVDCEDAGEVDLVQKFRIEHLFGWIYQNEGQLGKAATMFERALAWGYNSLGSDHPSIKEISTNLTYLRSKIAGDMEVVEWAVEGSFHHQYPPTGQFQGFVE